MIPKEIEYNLHYDKRKVKKDCLWKQKKKKQQQKKKKKKKKKKKNHENQRLGLIESLHM